MSAVMQQSLIQTLRPVLPEDRIGTYLTAAGFNETRALDLYWWNVEIGEAFHMPIQAVEVSLRNRVASAFDAVFGPLWWSHQDFRRTAGRTGVAEIETAIKRIRQRGQILTTNQLIASLPLGFWVGLMRSRFNPEVWSTQLRATFPSLPSTASRYDMVDLASEVLYLRNRIDHHEPIFKMDLSKAFADQMRLLCWICPVMHAVVRPKCRVMALLRRKP